MNAPATHQYRYFVSFALTDRLGFGTAEIYRPAPILTLAEVDQLARDLAANGRHHTVAVLGFTLLDGPTPASRSAAGA